MTSLVLKRATDVVRKVVEGEVVEEPTLRVLSLGAGVQSTTLFILSAIGVLPKLDYAIFADTGAEPQEVYDHLDRLEREVAIPAGIPIIRVQYGDLEQHLFDPNRMSTIPAYTATEWRSVQQVAAWKPCAGDMEASSAVEGDLFAAVEASAAPCGWARFRALSEKRDWKVGSARRDWKALFAQGDGEMGALEVATLGRLGERVTREQLFLEVYGEDFRPDLEFVTAEMNPSVLVVQALEELGMDRLPAPCPRCDNQGRLPVAWQMVQERDLGMIQRRCTQKYKLRVIMEQVRLLLGAKAGRELPCPHCEGSGQRVAPWRAKRGETEIGECSVCFGLGTLSRVGQPPKGRWVEQWVGFSTDEMDRVSDRMDSRYSKTRHPLLELKMSRAQCRAFLASRGWASTPKSACYFCPYRSNASWRRMRDTNPAEWQRAVEFDRKYRTGPGLDGERFLHISALPLDEAPIDRIQRREFEQSDLLDTVFEGELDLEYEQEDEVQGCSPFGCPSGGQNGGLLTIQRRPAA